MWVCSVANTADSLGGRVATSALNYSRTTLTGAPGSCLGGQSCGESGLAAGV